MVEYLMSDSVLKFDWSSSGVVVIGFRNNKYLEVFM